MKFAELLRSIVFEHPAHVSEVASWHGHIPFAFWCVEMVQPRIFVELGTHQGDSYCAFCQAVDTLGLATACYAVDTWQGDAHAGFYGAEVYETLQRYHAQRYGAFSRLVRATFDEAVGSFADGSIDLLHLDGLHTYASVQHDFETWFPKLSAHAVVLLHNINVRERDFGAWRWWEECCERYPHFSFPHSHGLGVLAVGQQPPPAIQRLCSLREDEAAQVRSIFAGLGHTVSVTSARDALTGQAARLESILAEREDRLNQRAGDLAAVYRARSWRVPKPLRVVMGRGRWTKGLLRRPWRLLLLCLPSSLCKRFRLWWHAYHIRRSGLFDAAFYRQQNPDVVAARMEPVIHYLQFGAAEGRDPSPWFTTAYYLQANPDVALAGVNPLVHYMRYGAREGRPPRPLARPDSPSAPAAQEVQRSGPGLGSSLAVLALLAREYISSPGKLIRHVRVGLGVLSNEGPRGLARRIRKSQGRSAGPAATIYDAWIQLYDTLGPTDIRLICEHIGRLDHRPLISVVIPVYNTPEHYLWRAIESVRAQIYENWELCIADDCSITPYVQRMLEHYASLDSRIKVCFRDRNGHISAASNSALALASGEYIALLDHDDEIPPHALYMVAATIARHPEANIVYSDEDKIDLEGHRYDPYFKCDWNEGLFYSHNMISHLGVYRTSLVKKIGGFREGYEGSQDYDLALRCIEHTEPEQIVHIPFILYHWRAIPGSTASASQEKDYAHTAALHALNDHFRCCGYLGKVVEGAMRGINRARFFVLDPPPLVNIIIPTRDAYELLCACVESVLGKTTYPNYEILIVDNQSSDPQTLSYLDQMASHPRVRILRYDAPFNYSAINNFAVRQCRGEVICLLNNDIEVIAPDWLDEMVGHAMRPVIGAVGAKLLYPDNTVQHAGVVLGVHGVAGHAYKHLSALHTGYFGRAVIGQELSAVTAACLVVRREVYKQVGGLDEEHLTVAFNDIDFCLRLRRAGYRNYWTPYAVLYHYESKSRGYEDTPAKQARFQAEIAYMQAKWHGWLEADPAYSSNLTLDAENFTLAFPPRVGKPWAVAAMP